jgi:hypothetical protein
MPLSPGDAVQIQNGEQTLTGHISSIEDPGRISRLGDRDLLQLKKGEAAQPGQISCVMEIIVPWMPGLPTANLIAIRAMIPCPWVDSRKLDVFPAEAIAEYITRQSDRDPNGYSFASRQGDSKQSFEKWLCEKLTDFYTEHFKDSGVAPPASPARTQ